MGNETIASDRCACIRGGRARVRAGCVRERHRSRSPRLCRDKQPGPLQPCSDDGSDCTARNTVWFFFHVANHNQLPNPEPGNGPKRATLSNAYVLQSVDESFLLNGVEIAHDTVIPPPNVTDRFGTAGRWPSSVTCGQPITLPCNTVISPAILPGEDAVAFFDGWIHEHLDGSGLLVIQLTMHGTLNGDAVDLTASSQPILERP